MTHSSRDIQALLIRIILLIYVYILHICIYNKCIVYLLYDT